jgi:signal peptidase I
MAESEASGVIVPELEHAQEDVEPAGDDEFEPAAQSWRRFFVKTLIAFVIAFAVAVALKSFVVQPFFIPSGSMENTLLIGDRVLVNKLAFHLRAIHRGDIVVFNGTGSWDPPAHAVPPHNPLVRGYDDTLGRVLRSITTLYRAAPGETDYAKRVIGLPGDRVACCNALGQMTVNGVALHERPFLFPAAQPSQYHFSIVVPPGRLWVMGDNRPYSADSRLHDCAYTDPETQCAPYDRNGTIPEDKVIGRAFMIVWPPGQIKTLPIPATFSQQGLSRPSNASGYLAMAGAVGVAGQVGLVRFSRRRRPRPSRRRGRSGPGGRA